MRLDGKVGDGTNQGEGEEEDEEAEDGDGDRMNQFISEISGHDGDRCVGHRHGQETQADVGH